MVDMFLYLLRVNRVSLPLNQWPSTSTISFKDVVFNYKQGGTPVLKGLFFNIRNNVKIGIVGRTGAGKSSLTMALFRINELVSGRILTDGTDIASIASMPLRTLRSNLSIIPQSPVLCMARALLTQSRIVVMDEATASIDHATEKKLQRMINDDFQDATVLTIAHRLGTVLDSDRIVVLSDGRVVEFDSPRNLVRNGKGIFYELAKEGGYLERLQEADVAC